MTIDHVSGSGNLIIESLIPECRRFVEARSSTKPVVSGEVLYEANEPLNWIIFLHDGLVSLQYTTQEGRTVEKLAIGIDGAVGVEYLLGADRFPSHAVAVISGRASWLPIQDFVVALKNFPCMQRALSHYIARKLQYLMQVVVCANTHSAIARLSTWLLHAADKTHTGTFDITQRMLADILGLRLATVSESCNKLLNLGAIHYTRGQLKIVDRDALEQQACECYGVVSLENLCAMIPRFQTRGS